MMEDLVTVTVRQSSPGIVNTIAGVHRSLLKSIVDEKGWTHLIVLVSVFGATLTVQASMVESVEWDGEKHWPFKEGTCSPA